MSKKEIKEGDVVVVLEQNFYQKHPIGFIGQVYEFENRVCKVSSYNYYVNGNGKESKHDVSKLRLATPEEKEKYLLEVARREYPEGTEYISAFSANGINPQKVVSTLNYSYDMITDGNGGAVYCQGKWAKKITQKGVSTELTELPRFWCVKIDEDVAKWVTKNTCNSISEINTWSFIGRDRSLSGNYIWNMAHTVKSFNEKLTEITKQQFLKWVVGEESDFNSYKSIPITESLNIKEKPDPKHPYLYKGQRWYTEWDDELAKWMKPEGWYRKHYYIGMDKVLGSRFNGSNNYETFQGMHFINASDLKQYFINNNKTESNEQSKSIKSKCPNESVSRRSTTERHEIQIGGRGEGLVTSSRTRSRRSVEIGTGVRPKGEGLHTRRRVARLVEI